MVIVMHGDGGNGAGIESGTGFDAVADTARFLALYPDAVSSAWNRYVDNMPGDAGLGNPNAPDDVQFIADLIDHCCQTYHIDPTRVYATGYSAGGFMAYALAVQLPHKIAAFAPVSASLWGDATYINNYFGGAAYTAVPIYHVHGDADNVVDYPDPDNTPVAWAEWPLSGFSYANCSHDTYTATSTLVSNSVYELSFCDGSGANGKKVSLIRVKGMGHSWPNIAGYNGSAAIWSFFRGYSIASALSCTATGIESVDEVSNMSVYPNPVQDLLQIRSSEPIRNITISDMNGQVISDQTSAAEISTAGWASGMYIMHVNNIKGNLKTLKFIKE
jgi:poly(3-hydroxybutyrate) depolymerase